MATTDDALSRRLLMAGALGGLSAGLCGPAPAAAAAAAAALESPDVVHLPRATAPWTREGYVRRPDGRIHWVEIGQGPPVVLLPKLGGWIADWRNVARLLAPKNRVIVLDLPGHGDSVMNGPPPFLLTQEEQAATIMAALDALGVERCPLIGNSMGGSISLVAAVLWPQRVSHVAMVTTAMPGAVPLQEIVAASGNSGQIYDGPMTYEDVYKLFGSTRETYAEHVLSQKKAGDWKNPGERGVRRAGLIDYWARVTVPTMMIYGTRAGQTYQRFVPEMKKRRPDIPIVHIPDAGTFAHQDNPAGTAEVLRRFIG